MRMKMRIIQLSSGFAAGLFMTLVGCDDKGTGSQGRGANQRNATFLVALNSELFNPRTNSYGILAERIRLVDRSGVTDPILLALQDDYYQLCRISDRQGWTLQDGDFSVGGALVGMSDPQGTFQRVQALSELNQRIIAKLSILKPRYSRGGH